ncbi:SchA/CurD-like domain-containing protein [Streptomyces sp. H10-C2]|uniref:SchA/CurD-like domain-containing protein n=1 Tax=unclassified Streptomyces TaxID=2593676 RepID=UPI0024BA8BFA|nr:MULTISPECIES: SchA/CurD-like domain-containing protein [unclassified Streptomyces]MDJ0346946.1 SchA/CurD-like domain-containing protein [Streptomyces sp. PH10-H1]MDJ0370469.1 SchA/CurD-like domain-containing protein [Streptomyces sp. H10-C2]
MPYAAIVYRVKPGNEDEIAKIFENFNRVDTADTRTVDGTQAGRILGTGLFIKDDVMVRVIHYEGDLASVGRHMATQPGVHSAEDRLAPYLLEERDTSSPQAFATFFRNASMRSILQLSVETLETKA